MEHSLAYAPQFGVYHLTLNEAGLLIAKCLWFRGELRCAALTEEVYDFNAAELETALEKPAAKYTAKLLKAVQAGSLQSANITRDIDDAIRPSATYLEVFALAEWLTARGINLGSAFEEDYLEGEAAIAAKLASFAMGERLRQRQAQAATDQQITEAAEVLFLRHRIVELETELSKLREPQRHHHPVTEKQKSAYLNIIGALVGVLLGTAPSGQPYSKFQTQQAIIDAIHANFGELPGLSTRNLQGKFAEGRCSVNS